jgi:hypothetical protein
MNHSPMNSLISLLRQHGFTVQGTVTNHRSHKILAVKNSACIFALYDYPPPYLQVEAGLTLAATAGWRGTQLYGVQFETCPLQVIASDPSSLAGSFGDVVEPFSAVERVCNFLESEAWLLAPDIERISDALEAHCR